jgi:hypothetical protein
MGRPTSHVATAQPFLIIADQVRLDREGKAAQGHKVGVFRAERVEDEAIEGLAFNGIAIEHGSMVDVIEDFI